MNPLVFLLIPVVIVLLASFVMYLRGRKPTTLRSGIDSFQREMDALSPERGNERRPRRFDSDSSPGPVRPQRDS